MFIVQTPDSGLPDSGTPPPASFGNRDGLPYLPAQPAGNAEPTGMQPRKGARCTKDPMAGNIDFCRGILHRPRRNAPSIPILFVFCAPFRGQQKRGWNGTWLAFFWRSPHICSMHPRQAGGLRYDFRIARILRASETSGWRRHDLDLGCRQQEHTPPRLVNTFGGMEKQIRRPGNKPAIPGVRVARGRRAGPCRGKALRCARRRWRVEPVGRVRRSRNNIACGSCP